MFAKTVSMILKNRKSIKSPLRLSALLFISITFIDVSTFHVYGFKLFSLVISVNVLAAAVLCQLIESLPPYWVNRNDCNRRSSLASLELYFTWKFTACVSVCLCRCGLFSFVPNWIRCFRSKTITRSMRQYFCLLCFN